MKSLKKGELTLEEVAALLPLARSDYARETIQSIPDYIDDEYDVEVLFSAVSVQVPSFEVLFEQAEDYVLVVIDGDLDVGGLFIDSELEPESIVVVTGTLLAGNIATAGFLDIGGNLQAKGCIAGAGNDCDAVIGGDLKARLLLTGYHHFTVGGQVLAPAYDPRIACPEGVQRLNDDELLALVDPALIELEHEEVSYVDQFTVRERLATGGSVFRGG